MCDLDKKDQYNFLLRIYVTILLMRGLISNLPHPLLSALLNIVSISNKNAY